MFDIGPPLAHQRLPGRGRNRDHGAPAPVIDEFEAQSPHQDVPLPLKEAAQGNQREKCSGQRQRQSEGCCNTGGPKPAQRARGHARIGLAEQNLKQRHKGDEAQPLKHGGRPY